jgi:hypothetical protein
VIAVALQSAAFSRNRISRFLSPYANNAYLGIVFERTLILCLRAIRKLPDSYAIVPAAPVIDHDAIPGRTRRDDGDHDPAWHEQQARIGYDAIFGAFAILEKVGRVCEHEAHAPFGDAHPLKGTADEFCVRQARSGNSSPFSADLHTVEPSIWDF